MHVIVRNCATYQSPLPLPSPFRLPVVSLPAAADAKLDVRGEGILNVRVGRGCNVGFASV